MLLVNTTYKVISKFRAHLGLRKTQLTLSPSVADFGPTSSHIEAITESNAKIRVDVNLIGSNKDKIRVKTSVTMLTHIASNIEDFTFDDYAATRVSDFVRKSLLDNISTTFYYVETDDGFDILERDSNDTRWRANTDDENMAKLMCKLLQGKQDKSLEIY